MPQKTKTHNGKDYNVIVVPGLREQQIYSPDCSYSSRVYLISLIEMDHAEKRVFDIPFVLGFIPSMAQHKIQMVFCTRKGLFMHDPVEIPLGLAESDVFIQGYAENELFYLLENHDFDMRHLYEKVKFSEMLQEPIREKLL